MAYRFVDDRSLLDPDAAWAYLSTEAYWGRWRDRADFDAQVASAWRVVGCLDGEDRTVGFARAISDGVSLAYLADVFVAPEHRGHGLGVRLVEVMVDEGPGRDFRWLLHTRDAHGLYARLGFGPPDATYIERAARGRRAT